MELDDPIFENLPNFLEEFDLQFTNNAIIQKKIDEMNNTLSDIVSHLDVLTGTASNN